LIVILQADYIKFKKKFIRLPLDDCNIKPGFIRDLNFADAADRKKAVSHD